MNTYFPKGMYFAVDYKPIFTSLKDIFNVIEEENNFFLGQFGEHKIALFANMSITIDCDNLDEELHILDLVEQVATQTIKGFNYKLTDDLLEIKIERILFRNGMIEGNNLSLTEKKCIRELIELII